MENRKIKILAIDDNQDNLIIIKALIRETFPEAITLTALNGPTGLEYAASEDPDVILLDIVMPDMDGFEVCKKLKADKMLCDIPVVFVTAIKGDKVNRIRALESGAESFLAKPIDETELMTQIRAMVKIKKASTDKRNENIRLSALVEEQTEELSKAYSDTVKLLEEVNRKNIAIEKSEAFTKGILQTAIDGFWIVDLKGKFIEVNEVACKMVGYTREEMLEISISELEILETAEQTQNHLRKIMITGQDRFESKHRCNNGEVIDVELSIKMQHDQNLFVVFVRDITESKLAKQTLLENESRLRTITNTAQDAILMMNHEGEISFWNPAAERIFGYSGAEAIGQNLHKFIVPQRFHQAHHAAFRSFQETGQGAAIGQTLDLQALRKDGSEIEVQLSLSAKQTSGKWNSVGILRDITAQKNDQLALVKAKQEAEAANKSKSMFLANMSHEIRTPLNAIIGFSQLMNRDKNSSPSQKEYSLSIIRAGEHLLSLINEILELSKIEAGKVELIPVNIDLFSFLDNIQLIFKEQAKSKKLHFIFEKSNDLPRYVFIDEGKLRQIFVNLIGNALKFTREGGVAVRICIVKEKDNINHLVVEVQDSGPGIAENELHKLFKNFEQTSSGMNKGSGTGLGLAVSRELTILMGGGIKVSSEIGKGSVFTFHVEIKEGNSASVESVESDKTKSVIGIKQSGKIYRILVVDDKKENLKVAITFLQIAGFQTMEAINGEDAIGKFNEWNPDLILMDMRMPVMDGYEATRRIKATEKGQNIPIVALTASIFEDELKQIDALRIQGYIRKPFRENELFNTIGKLLEINYIYADESASLHTKYLNDDNALNEDIAKVPGKLVIKMQQALEVADLDQLIELIKTMENENPELTQQLLNLAINFDYDKLLELLNYKEEIACVP